MAVFNTYLAISYALPLLRANIIFKASHSATCMLSLVLGAESHCSNIAVSSPPHTELFAGRDQHVGGSVCGLAGHDQRPQCHAAGRQRWDASGHWHCWAHCQYPPVVLYILCLHAFSCNCSLSLHIYHDQYLYAKVALCMHHRCSTLM